MLYKAHGQTGVCVKNLVRRLSRCSAAVEPSPSGHTLQPSEDFLNSYHSCGRR
ncbi:hypothetical protein BDV97DRAFT_362843 [Delphinella strobiligena]|nr:hypothetical protein BDV97DRAFT_362843 [Delphinella strobiligena]